jgi:hypothetical protein
VLSGALELLGYPGWQVPFPESLSQVICLQGSTNFPTGTRAVAGIAGVSQHLDARPCSYSKASPLGVAVEVSAFTLSGLPWFGSGSFCFYFSRSVC